MPGYKTDKPANVYDTGKWKLYRFRFAGGRVGSGQPLAAILGRLGVNVKNVAENMNKLTMADYADIKVEILLYLNKKTKDYYLELGRSSVTTMVLKQMGLKKFAGAESTSHNISSEKLIKVVNMAYATGRYSTMDACKKNINGAI